MHAMYCNYQILSSFSVGLLYFSRPMHYPSIKIAYHKRLIDTISPSKTYHHLISALNYLNALQLEEKIENVPNP